MRWMRFDALGDESPIFITPYQVERVYQRDGVTHVEYTLRDNAVFSMIVPGSAAAVVDRLEAFDAEQNEQNEENARIDAIRMAPAHPIVLPGNGLAS